MRERDLRPSDRLVTPDSGGRAVSTREVPWVVEIAGVRFRGASPESGPSFPASYQTFCETRYHGHGVVEVGVSVLPGELLTAPPKTSFRTDSWSVVREGAELHLTLDPDPLPGKTVHSARFSPVSRQITVANPRPVAYPLSYPLDQLLMICLLAPRHGALFHAAGYGFRGRGLAFLGPSGAGKSTLSSQLRESRDWQPLSDDRVVIRAVGDEHLLFGTPWPGTGRVAENASFPLAGLVFLRQGREHRIMRLSSREAFERLLVVASIPWFDREIMLGALEYCDALTRRVPCSELTFRPERSLERFLTAHFEPMAGPS